MQFSTPNYGQFKNEQTVNGAENSPLLKSLVRNNWNINTLLRSGFMKGQ